MAARHNFNFITPLLAILNLILSVTSVPVTSLPSDLFPEDDNKASAESFQLLSGENFPWARFVNERPTGVHDFELLNGGDVSWTRLAKNTHTEDSELRHGGDDPWARAIRDDKAARSGNFDLSTATDGPWSRSIDNSALVPASSSPSLSTRGEPDWLVQLRGRSYHPPPYCMQQILGWCSLTSVVRNDGKTADYLVFDDRCTAKGHNKAELPVKAFKFGSLNGGEIMLQQFSNAEPHSYTFHNRGYGWGFTNSWCWNAGVSNNYPGFRMACTSGFDCSTPEASAGKVARAEDFETSTGGDVP
ncbi:hypothetical protein ONS95_000870 [Cadophora gregata]|uniref:uncharacterized protein n=1 Tax=Cadophora gregata TaxID=51156 RepID=UPI0026DC90DE|nr:uncharacterized protein ONS95_000870 [Cadophora gregata]KAK0102938.1 hypothetical protein ONS96_005563 [Cadophora gregata f. sp. sojae]KAK0128926.1 hypothetical protein ONS95_000870 [Cadophora gregata]